MWWVTNASNNFAGLRRYNGSAWQNYVLMADSVIAAKSVTAPLLEANLVLASKIQAGPTAESHTYMNSTGIHFMSKIGSNPVLELLRINSPAGETEEAEVFSLRRATDLSDSIASISEAGAGSFASLESDGLTATESLTIAGETLEEMFDSYPRGAVVYGENLVRGKTAESGNTGDSSTGFQIALGEIRFSVEAGRVYRVTSTPVGFYIPEGVYAWLRATYTTDGSRPTLSSPTLETKAMPTTRPFGGRGIENLSYSFEYLPSGDWDVRILFHLGGYGSSTYNGTVTAYSSDTNVLKVFVQDLGKRAVASDAMVNRTDVKHGGQAVVPDPDPPAPPPAKKDYTWTEDCSNLKTFWVSTGEPNSYYAIGKAATGSYTGSAPQKLRGRMYFGSQASRLSGADIVSVEAYIYMSHWYSSAGGSASIGHDTSTTDSNPSSLTSDGAGKKSFSTNKPGGTWVKMDSSSHAGIKSGSVRAFILSSSSSSVAYYGYATSGKIRIKYRK